MPALICGILLTSCGRNDEDVLSLIPIGSMDENFQLFLLENFDVNKDGFISTEEAELIKEINCTLLYSIKSLDGLHYFPNLEKLYCAQNGIEKIDVSKNLKLNTLICNYNSIEKLDVSNNPALETLICNDQSINTLKSIKINQGLKTLDMRGHTLNSLDFRGNKSLKTLYCGGSELITLDVSNSALDSLDCTYYISSLVSLNINECNSLKTLSVTNINSLALNCPQLENLTVEGPTGISNLDVSRCPLLKSLSFVGSFDHLDLSNNPDLEYVTIKVPSSSILGTIDVSKNYKLKNFEVALNGYAISTLKILDFSNHTALKSVSMRWEERRYAGVNPIELINLSWCSSLESLTVTNAGLKALNISGCSALLTINCISNQLTELNLHGCSKLKELDCTRNHQLATMVLTDCRELLTLMCTGGYLTELDLEACTKITELDCSENQLTRLKTNSKNLSKINCQFNALTAIDILGNETLKQLQCNNNQISSLDLRGFSSLEEVICNHNPMTSLILGGCTALKNLNCEACSLSTLDVSHCTVLDNLTCSYNQLKPSLDVSKCTKLTAINCFYNPELTELILYCSAPYLLDQKSPVLK